MDYFLKADRLGFSEWKYEYFPFALELWGDPIVSKLFTVNVFFQKKK
jgi:hypothetical protein